MHIFKCFSTFLPFSLTYSLNSQCATHSFYTAFYRSNIKYTTRNHFFSTLFISTIYFCIRIFFYYPILFFFIKYNINIFFGLPCLDLAWIGSARFGFASFYFFAIFCCTFLFFSFLPNKKCLL